MKSKSGSENNLMGAFKRIPSPNTYYTNFNKKISEQHEYFQTKNYQNPTWKQQFKQFNQFENEEIFSEKYRERTRNIKKQQQIEEDQDDNRKRREKEMFLHTQQLERMISQHNKEAPIERVKQLRKIKKNIELIGFINNKQRKLYSDTKQKNEYIQKMREGLEPQITKESMDRKGLALRIVLSSIPIEKLKKLLEIKHNDVKKVIDNLAEISSQTKLNKTLEPRQRLSWEIKKNLNSSFISRLRRDFLNSRGSAPLRQQTQQTQMGNMNLTTEESVQGAESQGRNNMQSSKSMRIRNRQEVFIQTADRRARTTKFSTREASQQLQHQTQSQQYPHRTTAPKNHSIKIQQFMSTLKTGDQNEIQELKKTIQAQDHDIFDYKSYFYNKYSSKNKGIDMKISRETQLMNESQQRRIDFMIDQITLKDSRISVPSIAFI